MSGTWGWTDNSSSSAHLQRIANSTATRSQKAYRAYIDHAATCPACGETKCPEADELWQAYQAARGEGQA